MSDVSTAAPEGSGTAPLPAAAVTPEASHTPSDLGRMLASLRQAKAPESAETATEPEEEIPAQAENAAPAEEQPSGEATEEKPEPAEELPPIEPPRSWTKEAKERFESLPRETQEYLAAREQERDREVRRSQNEAAEQRKAIEAERQKAEQVRQQYEAKLPALMETLQRQSQFSDIRTMDDVKNLQATDPFRFQAWQIHQMDMQAVQHEVQQAEERKAQEQQTQWAQHVQKENELFAEKFPEAADKEKMQKLTTSAVDVLRDKGFTDQELAELAGGKKSLSIYDHRLQLLILDGVKYRDVQKAKATVATKPVPPVQKPGVAPPRGAAGADAIQTISAKLERTGNVKDLGSLIGALRRA